ncbi:MAG: hypothetical protein AB1603_06685 [Chloroflexota bacterium]
MTGWEQDALTLDPEALPFEGGSVTATVVTRERGAAVSLVTFNVTGLDFSDTRQASVREVAQQPSYTTRSWSATFTLPRNDGAGSFVYTVVASSPQVEGTRSGSVTVTRVPIVVTAVFPTTVYRGGTAWFTVSLKNLDSRWYQDVYVDGAWVSNPNTSWLLPAWPLPASSNDRDESNRVMLPPGGSADVALKAYASTDQPLGAYTLGFYLRFTDEDGRSFRGPYYYVAVTLVE